MKKYLYLLMTVFAVLGYSGCNPKDDAQVTGADNYDQLISSGNAKFLTGDFVASLENFSKAFNANSTRVEGYVGTGWSYMKSGKISEAKTRFTEGLQKFPQNCDMIAGMAVILNIEGDFFRSNQKAELVMTLSTGWQLSLDNRIDQYSLYVLRAQDYFQLSDYTSSLIQVKLVNPGFSLNYINDVSSQAYLGAEIERLSRLYIF